MFSSLKKPSGLLQACFVAIALSQNPGNCAHGAVTGVADCHLIEAPFERFSAETTSKDFFVQLPEHISIQPGSEVNLVLRKLPPFDASTLAISVNGQKILTTNLNVKPGAEATNVTFLLRTTVPPENLDAGWNRISLEWSSPQTANRQAAQSTWSIWRVDSYLRVVYRKPPLFPELARFPASIAEEQLLRQGRAPSEFSAAVAILLPPQRRDVHLRSAAILGARLGQLGYLSEGDCRVGSVADWAKHASERNGVAVGRWDELNHLPLIANVAASITALKGGEGLVAEFITGNDSNQRRWVFVTGRDDAGVEKAALTLGSVHTLASAPPSPAVIETEPALPETLATQKTGIQRIALKNIGLKEVQLRGRHSEKSVSGWCLPPGVELASGSFLELHLSHSKALTDSSLEVLVNGVRAGRVALMAENASPTTIKVPLPERLPSRDPMIVTLRATLKGGAENRGVEDELWVTVSGDSTLEAATDPIRITGLHQVHQFLVRDPFLRKAAFVVPQNLSWEELQLMVDLSLSLGKQLPSSAALWPEACSYSTGRLPEAARLLGRSVLLLAPVPQWKAALPTRTRLAIGPPNGNGEIIRIQGRQYKFSSFEPSLIFMQMLPSPWSGEETLVTVGGWKDFSSPTVKVMLTEAASSGRLYGDLSAMDAAGRITTYDSGRPSADSFAERLQKRMPSGLSSEETVRQLKERDRHVRRSGYWNDRVFYWVGALLLFCVAIRLLLLWDRDQSRKKSMRGEKPLGSAT